MNRLFFAFFGLAALSGCGALVSNTDVPTGPYISAPALDETGGARLATLRPQSGGVEMSGISCRNRVWDPAPSADRAALVLRREAAAAGFDSVVITAIAPVQNALSLNCWSAIRATGIAFNG